METRFPGLEMNLLWPVEYATPGFVVFEDVAGATQRIDEGTVPAVGTGAVQEHLLRCLRLLARMLYWTDQHRRKVR